MKARLLAHIGGGSELGREDEFALWCRWSHTPTMDPTGEHEATLPTYDENGVDLTHIREFLKLSLDDRLRTLEEFLAAMATVEFEVER